MSSTTKRAQTFGPGIDSRGDPRRAAADDEHVEGFVVAKVEIEAEQPRDLVRRGIGHDDVAPENHRRLRRRDGATVGGRLRFGASQRHDV